MVLKSLLIVMVIFVLMEDSTSIRKTEDEKKEEEEVARAVNKTLAEEEKKRQEEEDEKKKLDLEKKKETRKKKDEKVRTQDKTEDEDVKGKDKDEACPPLNFTCPTVKPCDPCPGEKPCPKVEDCLPCTPCGPCPMANNTVEAPHGCQCPEGSGLSLPTAMAVGAVTGLVVTGVVTIIGLVIRYVPPTISGFLFVATIIIVWYLSSHYPDTARELGGRVVDILREATTTLSHRVMEALQRHRDQVGLS
jgi:hypothetical protein